MKSKEESADTIKQSLQLISGGGPKLAQKFHDIRIKRISDFKGKKPEELYSRMCAKHGVQIDAVSSTFVDPLYILLRLKTRIQKNQNGCIGKIKIDESRITYVII